MQIWIKKSKDTIVLIPVVDSRFLFRTHLNSWFQYNKITILQSEQQSSSGEKNSK